MEGNTNLTVSKITKTDAKRFLKSDKNLAWRKKNSRSVKKYSTIRANGGRAARGEKRVAEGLAGGNVHERRRMRGVALL